MEHHENRNQVSFLIPLYLAIFGFLLNLIAYYPGFMSPDSLDIYEQSITHHYGDWHPLTMTLLWSGLNHIYQGPQTMLILQLAMLWSAFYFLATGWFSSRRSRAWLFLGILLAPFIQNFAGYIIGDVQMALSWFLSFSIIARSDHRNHRMTKIESFFSFMLIVYGALVRINALPGSLPLFYFWSGNFLKGAKRPPVLAGGVLVSITIVIGCQVLINHILKPGKQYPEYKLYLHDLSGIYSKTGKNYFPSFINQYQGFNIGYLKLNYTTATFDNLYWNAEKKISFPLLNDSTNHIIRQSWLNCIFKNPVVYLQNRWDGFLYFLRIKKRTWLVVLHAEVSPNKYQITFKENLISRLFLKPIKFQSWMPYMKPWFWSVANIIILMAAFFTGNFKIKRTVFVLATSSLLYLLPQFFIFQVDTDFRYFYWNCLSLFICILFLIKAGKLRNLRMKKG